MREALLNLIRRTIVYKYDLPNVELNIDRTIFSTSNDKCYEIINEENLSEIIYNSIIDYSFNEFEFETRDYNSLLEVALQERIRFNEDDSDETQLKYGFFGEVLLYSVLKVLYEADTIISRGFFYNPNERSEAKGYDSYHMIEAKDGVELWFGEAKFYKEYKNAIKSVLDKISSSLSDSYLRRNLLAIRQNKDRLNVGESKLKYILEDWSKNPLITIFDELKRHNIKLVYPIFILFEGDKDGYDKSIGNLPKYIKEEYSVPSFDLSIPCVIFFIFMPVLNVKSVKNEVLSWIKSRRQPIL